MADTSRLDELERKFAENPRRYFAPLANEHRKSGDLATAIAICREQLARYPGHMSGHVVLGQALYESRQPDEARTAFERALALDPENLIALRHLGDIARDRGDGVAARAWYQRVLEADPRNDDIAAQLQRLAPAAPLAPPSEPLAPSFAPPAAPATPAPLLEPLDWSSLDLELPGAAATPAEAAVPPAEPSISETAELPVAAAGPATYGTDPDTPLVEGDVGRPVLRTLPDGMPALDPVDWMELLPEHSVESETSPPAERVAESVASAPPSDWWESEAPAVVPAAREGAEQRDEARDEHGVPVDAHAPADLAHAGDEPVISTMEEIWVPASTNVVIAAEAPVEEAAAPADALDAPAASEPHDTAEQQEAAEPVDRATADVSSDEQPTSAGASVADRSAAGATAAAEAASLSADEEPTLPSDSGDDALLVEPAEFEPIALDGSFDMVLSATLDPTIDVALDSLGDDPGPEQEPAHESPNQPAHEPRAERWAEAEPLDLSPDGLSSEAPASDLPDASPSEAEEEVPLADAFADAPADSFGPEAIVLGAAAHAADAPTHPASRAEPESTYDPVVGLDLPPVDADEPEPYPLADEAPRSPTPSGVPSAAFMTETMAGLLLQQGHVDQALEVYDRLLAQRPDDEELAARVATLRASSHAGDPSIGTSAPRTSASAEHDSPQMPDGAALPAVGAAAGATAGAFFAALAAVARDESPNDAPVAQHPTATDSRDAAIDGQDREAPQPVPAAHAGLLSGPATDADEQAARRLAAAFGQPATPMASLADALFLGPPSLPAAALPPAVIEPALPSAGSGDFSFERFFEGLEEGDASSTATSAGTASREAAKPIGGPMHDPWANAAPPAVPPSAPPAPTTRAATPAASQPAVDASASPAATDDEDLAQFHAWLKGLMDS
jgi:hypothetical protein